MTTEKLLAVVTGCPNGITGGALLANGFSQDELDRAAALCLVRLEWQVVSGFTLTRYWSVRS